MPSPGSAVESNETTPVRGVRNVDEMELAFVNSQCTTIGDPCSVPAKLRDHTQTGEYLLLHVDGDQDHGGVHVDDDAKSSRLVGRSF